MVPSRTSLAKQLLWFLVLVSGCRPDLTADEESQLRAMELLSGAAPLSRTNAYADDPGAADLGRLLFFDKAMSHDGEVSCATCHDPTEGWSDPKPVSEGVEAQLGHRHSMPIPTAALQRFLLWDGRADSLWSQPLMALENEVEMDFSRTEVLHHVAQHYATEYEAIFDALPDVRDMPPRGKPGLPSWDVLSAEAQDDIQRVFVNVGKAIAAYERRIECSNTRFDRWARGELELTAEELEGATDFVREGCIDCHSGPAFTDFGFHNIGVGSNTNEADVGRTAALPQILESPFNAAGAYSDDASYGDSLHAAIAAEGDVLGAFRTPTLRGVGQRHFFGHRGQHEELTAFLDETYDDPSMQQGAVGHLDTKVEDVDIGDEEAMVAFLRTLDCPPLPPELLEP